MCRQLERVFINLKKCDVFLQHRHVSQHMKITAKSQFAILGVSENSSQEEIRTAFIQLAKRYHPDSCSEEADANKFAEIQTAYRELKINAKSCHLDDVETVINELNFKHITPQHRQYLSYDGVRAGTPFQRQQEYAKVRAIKAADNVLEHRLKKQTVDQEDKAVLKKQQMSYKHKIQTKYGFDRLVEDLIQESMSKGEFNNLVGSGKPLPNRQNLNPYVDFTTHKLNEVLIENGFTPEWITLQKEIRELTENLRKELTADRKTLGPFPFSSEEALTWKTILRKYENAVLGINAKINKYNLLVPILQKQMVLIKVENIAEPIIKSGKNKIDIKQETTQDCLPKRKFSGFLHALFNQLKINKL